VKAQARGGIPASVLAWHVYPAHAEQALRTQGLAAGVHGAEAGDGRVFLFCDRAEADWYARVQTEDAASEGFRAPDGSPIKMRTIQVSVDGLSLGKDWTLFSADKQNEASSAVWTAERIGPERIDPRLYHVSAPEASASIAERGLLAGHPAGDQRSSYGTGFTLVGPAVFLSPSLWEAKRIAETWRRDADVWAVNPEGLQLAADPSNPEHALYTSGDIAAARLSLLDPVVVRTAQPPAAAVDAQAQRSAEGFLLVAPEPSRTVGVRSQHDGASMVSETLGDQRSGSRGDGFFGTGAYFASYADAIRELWETDSPLGRATNSSRSLVGLDLSGANFCAPASKEDAWELHDWLGNINYEAIADARSPDPYDILSRALGRNAKELSRLQRLQAHVAHLPRALAGTDMTQALLQELAAEAAADLAAERYGTDSLSTRLLRRLGFDGVDVRHLPELDNSHYGSVLFRPRAAA
jgi:hypothetical protein